jgi:hypothetical protein
MHFTDSQIENTISSALQQFCQRLTIKRLEAENPVFKYESRTLCGWEYFIRYQNLESLRAQLDARLDHANPYTHLYMTWRRMGNDQEPMLLVSLTAIDHQGKAHHLVPSHRLQDNTPAPAQALPSCYVASKTHHAHLWKDWRTKGALIISTWIDEAGPGQTHSLSELWERIIQEIHRSDRLVLYVNPHDAQPLKGALVEVGMALMLQHPVYVVGLTGVQMLPQGVLDNDNRLGSWINHPLVTLLPQDAMAHALGLQESP